jgi:hypothetical protein
MFIILMEITLIWFVRSVMLLSKSGGTSFWPFNAYWGWDCCVLEAWDWLQLDLLASFWSGPEYCSQPNITNKRSIRHFEVTVGHQTYPKHPTHQGKIVVSLPTGWLLNSIPSSRIIHFHELHFMKSRMICTSECRKTLFHSASPPRSNLV